MCLQTSQFTPQSSVESVKPKKMKFNRSEIQPMNLLDRFSDLDDDVTSPEPKSRLNHMTNRKPSLCASTEVTLRRESKTTAGERQICLENELCSSIRDLKIKSALEDESSDLTGDFTKNHCLPTIQGRHSDLKSITPQTLNQLLHGSFDGVVDDFLIVDCRYPYEYAGGHITTAKNLYTQQLVDRLLSEPLKSRDPEKRFIIIFHCEFSSERGPKLLRFLRSQDRIKNAENYPQLCYPEIYLLDGGYKIFYEQFRIEHKLTYRLMLDEEYSEELRYYRTETKAARETKTSGKRTKSRRNMDGIKTGLRF